MSLLDLVLPPVCGACRKVGASPCIDCYAQLRPPPNGNTRPPGVTSLECCWLYEGVGRELITSLKYGNNRSCLKWCVGALASEVAGRGFDIVTWVPMAPCHRTTRSADHGRLLARGVASRLRIPYRGLLTRSDDLPQSSRDRRSREQGPALQASAWAATPAKSVLIIDDVVTTGASLANSARALRRAGALEVHALALAGTPLKVSRRFAE